MRTVGRWGAVALGAMVVAHVLGAGIVDPVIDPVSFYAFVPGGGEAILLGGTVLALVGLVVVGRAYRTGLATGPLPGAAMMVFAVAMVLVGVFPTDPPGVATTLSAVVHRTSAAAAFVVLPVVGHCVARQVGAPRSAAPRRLRRATVALAVLVAAFLAVHLPLAAVGSGIVAFGLLERVGFVLMIGYLFLLADIVDRESPGPARDPSPVPATTAVSEARPVDLAA
ncbi:uncharacterized protein DUF998 [Isoptericola sp. CG 20/1183]|uniref:Uncharacterized protein DUF998 n=1 Tax=Isoptericola halotolerans TaxID=300560 RepID=A0ABX5EFG5_9MICO|nr:MULTISPECIES: DUF998 domain-containing protein [Isoptericola]PRZ05622.1 uncharacterized protein DUF998 [Isoptericola halotolerans]PRZ06190.1 uncharacterized protein DUF998 [Isoptericola sp. CG 20/1183]